MTQSSNPVGTYLEKIQQELSTGHAQEHSYRPALKELFETVTGLRVVNEPKGSAHGRPDFIFVKGDVPIAWAEAKDLHVSLEKIEKSEQMERYFGYPTLILTNGLEFRFYRNGQRYGDAFVLTEKHGNTLEARPDAFAPFVRTLADFMSGEIDTIRSAEHLAKIMGGKAQRLRDNIIAMFDPAFPGSRGEIENIMQVLRQRLIKDLTVEQFADLYAQTLVYGLFVARYHDDSPDTFTRTEARERIPASNHLLQQFFDHIAGANFEKRLSFIVDELCDVFIHADVHALVHGLYLKKNDTHDPIIHFYEDFLREYDPKLRMERGVFYTPLPVVRYIVRSVDTLLKEHFSLPEGLADRAKIDWSRTVQGKKSKIQIDRVQMLDPAVGTGTFLNEIIHTIHAKFEGQQGMWPQYVEDHLIPRLHGFELMMASYTIAHLKLSMTLAESGVKATQKRLRVFLTNSLEEPADTDINLFTFGLHGALTEEAQAAAEVKRDYPIMVVLGNPPYSVSSQNASVEIGPDGKKRKTWIGKLLDDYKKDLNEKKINLDDDYIKFIRFAHYLIEKNGQGIVAMITNNSFLDGITHRRMRQHLLETFDHMYVVDLHGNSKRKEKAPDGGKDENVFDIMQGVGITLFVKTGEKKKGLLGTVHHVDVYGKREEKYGWLDAHDASNTKWTTLDAPEPNYFFVPKDFELQTDYFTAISIADLFAECGNGIGTDRDSLFYSTDKEELEKKINTFYSDEGIRSPFQEEFNVKDSSSYSLIERRNNTKLDFKYFLKAAYRPFDNQYLYYNPKLISRPAFNIMRHLQMPNLALLVTRQISSDNFRHVFCSDVITDRDPLSLGTRERTTVFPLYIYSNSLENEDDRRIPNLSMELLQPLLTKLQLIWKEDGAGDGKSICGPEDIFDYIYAVLHSSAYRNRYKEFLKIDFPRVPFTANNELFWKLVSLGREIRLLHLLESPRLGTLMTQYPIAGTNAVEKLRYEDGKVWINSTQYFGGVSKEAWEFPIGGYQPAQKWLKDRKERTLSSDDLLHYQKMILALTETGQLMREIDAFIEKSGGFPLS